MPTITAVIHPRKFTEFEIEWTFEEKYDRREEEKIFLRMIGREGAINDQGKFLRYFPPHSIESVTIQKE